MVVAVLRHVDASLYIWKVECDMKEPPTFFKIAFFLLFGERMLIYASVGEKSEKFEAPGTPAIMLIRRIEDIVSSI